jgi:uncharacterized phage protein (TIGR02220 family)
MPLSTQALYFHLGLNADDDGVVEAFVIMNQLGATEDELRILVAKGFVTILNEDLVSYINDWQENNHIRADRKIDSIYKPLLLQVMPDAKPLVSRDRADRVSKSVGTSHGQPTDDQGTAQVRLGKVRLGKDSKNNSAVETPAHPEWKTVVDYLNEKTGREGKSKFRYTSNSKKAIEARLHEGFTLEDCKTVIDKKTAEWTGTKWEQYLVVKTLFAPSHFESYLQAGESPKDKEGDSYGGLVF